MAGTRDARVSLPDHSMKEPRRVRSTCATATDHPMATTYRISDLAREFDLTPRAMRFYEDMGLLQPERAGPGGVSGCIPAATARA